jgi:hypothetical protein
MIRFLLLLLTLIMAPPLGAQAPEKDVAWDIVEGLTTEVGQRMAGTQAEARARDWAVIRLKSLGFSNVRIETYDMPVWLRGAESAEIVAPFPQKFAVTALGNSGSTGDAGFTLPVIGFDSLAALEAADPARVKGKIVFLSHAMKAAQDGSGYGPFGQARRAGPSVASKMGAAAIVVRSIGTDHSRAPHTGVQNWRDGAKPIPAGALSIADAENLQRMLARGKPVIMKLVLVSENVEKQQSGNVIAEVPGTDPAAGLVIIGAILIVGIWAPEPLMTARAWPSPQRLPKPCSILASDRDARSAWSGGDQRKSADLAAAIILRVIRGKPMRLRPNLILVRIAPGSSMSVCPTPQTPLGIGLRARSNHWASQKARRLRAAAQTSGN